MCHCKFMIVTDVPLHWGMLIVEEAHMAGGRSYIGNLCTFYSVLL